MKDFEIVPTQRFMLPKGSKGPETVAELKRLAEAAGGLLHPEVVVESARDERSPLHGNFLWDDSEAAQRYRLVQARMLLSISVEYVNDGPKKIPTKVFVSLSTDRHRKGGRGGYRTFIDVMEDPDKKKQLLQDADEAMTHFQEKYKSIGELSRVFLMMKRVKPLLTKKISQ